MSNLWLFAVGRVARAFPLVVLLLGFNFVMIHTAPGDPVAMLIGDAEAPELIETVRRDFGLDKSMPEQLIAYGSNIIRGNMGISYRYRLPVGGLITERLPATLLLMGSAFLISMLVGTILGVVAAVRRGTWLDSGLSVLALLGASVPVFWVGMLLLLAFAVNLRWLPLYGVSTVGFRADGIWDLVSDRVRHLILPSVTISVGQLALIFRVTRNRMIEELSKDYITQARAKGVPITRVWGVHALRNVALTLVTIAGLRIGVLFSGALLTEVVFAWPGIGQLMYGAMVGRDYPIVMGVFAMVVAVTVLANVVTDISYGFLDPRVRYG